ncbi:pyocin knob domain-containing protein [Brucella pseudogrignonensis]|uniref:pyocin knob domain-containing protein n=1 Tax=Brucella pseudogrignonensis TaxID=419475 RepID=UPI001E5366BA|nr:pyocin knob domain-containing protein [Brucella pseudogrignonensis]MCD4512470.1 pyocin knob domain-containing protein [Brucella pseudogrignonensis]
MAVLSDYTSGTITLANGSTTVTGTGTMFQAAAFKAGDTLQIQNLTAVIASVNSNTSLTLSSPWTGTSLTNAPYRARYLPDGARVTAQTTTLIELLGNGVLTNLAELGVEDGKVPVGNASGEYELKPTSSFGVQDPNGTLAAIVEAQGIPNNQLPARIREATVAINDANLATVNGWNVIGGDGSNIPVPLAGFVFTIAQSTNLLTQIWYQRAGYRSFMRFCNNGTWGSWAERASTASAAALALLQLTGAANALPYFTGAGSAATTTLSPFARTVIDDASGAAMFATMGATQSLGGGSGYSKDPNGSLCQWGTAIVTPTASGFGSIPFPIAFSNTNFIVTPTNGDHNTQLYMLIVTNRASLNAARFDFRAVNANSGVAITDPVRINYIAMGN